ncbi:MAG TPA: phage holin family protein [Candidatus Saccharimonadales bacterium]|jgi:putative membrane protein|nr:phage holin family protein [Candidatus Saccharimonadales bacterium]
MKLLLRWLISAISLLVVAHVVQGFHLRGFIAALLAAVVVGFVNATLGVVLKFLTFPLTVFTLGLFLIVVNAVVLKMAAAVTPGFEISSWWAALIGALLLSMVSMFLNWLIGDKRERRPR